MRGAPCRVMMGSSTSRIIPADAGSRAGRRAGLHIPGDHPRGCGEHVDQDVVVSRCDGSSPRMRGAPARKLWNSLYSRAIPADAGSTDYPARPAAADQDHPRGCGEHPSVSGLRCVARESSPRMRGAHIQGQFDSPSSGIIPADAGSTMGLCKVAFLMMDHPRGCGEHPVVPDPHSQMRGSSPRMRGAPRLCHIADTHRGIIPADAGSTH